MNWLVWHTVSGVKLALLLLSLSMLASAAAQDLPCITSVKRAQFDEHGRLKGPPIPSDLKPYLPRGATVQLVVPLSASDTLMVYEAGNNGDADTRLLVTRRGHPLVRIAIKDLPDDHEWGMWLRAMAAAHLCANGNNLTYVVLQTGNQGGYFVVLTERTDGFHLLPIKAVQQGRLVLNVNAPSRITVWSVAPDDATECTGCPKHYVVETMEFKSNSFNVVEKRRTASKYNSFQEEPLKLSH